MELKERKTLEWEKQSDVKQNSSVNSKLNWAKTTWKDHKFKSFDFSKLFTLGIIYFISILIQSAFFNIWFIENYL